MEKKRKWIIIAALLLFLCLGVAWIAGAFDDGQLAKVQEKYKQFEDSKDLSWEQRREAFKDLRKEIDQLPKDQRAQFSPGRHFAHHMQERLKHYFELSPEERIAELDKQIQRMEEMKRRWEEQQQANGNGANGKDSQSSNGDNGAGQNDKAADNNGKSGSDSNSNNWRNMDRQTRMRAMIDSTSADQRAQMGQFRMDMNQRRAQLNLPPMQGPGGGGGGWMRPH